MRSNSNSSDRLVEDNSLNEQVRRNRLEGTVTFTGEVPHEEALNRVASADACVCILSADVKNYRRTYPIKLFEYMALAKPIIATDLPGIANVIENETNGLLVPPHSPERIADRVKQLIEDHTMRETLAERAGKDAKQYAWADINDVVVDRIEATIQE